MFHRSPTEMFFRFKAIGARLADFQKLKIWQYGKGKICQMNIPTTDKKSVYAN